MKKTRLEYSKKLLKLDYIIAGILLGLFIACLAINGIYTMITMNNLIATGYDVSMIVIAAPFNLEIFGTILGIWIAQLGISTGAYYIMAKSDHKIQLPMMLINELPKDIKDQVDMTTIITTALTCTEG